MQEAVKGEEEISEQVVDGNVHASNVFFSHEIPTLNRWAGSYLPFVVVTDLLWLLCLRP